MYAAFGAEYERHDVRNYTIFLFYLMIFTFSTVLLHLLHTYDRAWRDYYMGLKDKLRKFCVMKSVREKAKEDSEDSKNN